MRNKNRLGGFTLVELLGVIVILSIVIGISIVTFTTTKKRILQKDYENIVSWIETKATEYAVDTGITKVSVEKLILEGYLEPDDETDIYNPQNKESLNCYIINSVFSNGEYSSVMSENNLRNEEGTCDNYITTGEYEICQMNDNNCTAIPNEWLNDNIILGVKNSRTGKIITQNDGTTFEWTSSIGNFGNESTLPTTVSLAATGLFQVKVTIGQKVGEATKTIKIDKQAPRVTNIKTDASWSATLKTAIISATDYDGSGVAGIYVGDTSTCTKDLPYESISYGEFIKDNLEEGQYNVCVKDKVGNYSPEPLTFHIENIDKEGADGGIYITEEPTTWSREKTLTGYAKDTKSGIVAYQFTTSPQEPSQNDVNWISINRTGETTNTKEKITENRIYYYWIKDAVGNISRASYEVTTIDREIDRVSLNSSTEEWVTSLQLNAIAMDFQSGLVAYQLTESASEPTNWIQVENQATMHQEFTITKNGTYYFWVKDAVGNTKVSQAVHIATIGKLYTMRFEEYSRKSSTIKGSQYIKNIKKIVNITIDNGYVTNTYINSDSIYYTLNNGRTYTDEEWDVCTKPSHNYNAYLEEGGCSNYRCNYGGEADRNGICTGYDYPLKGDPFIAYCTCKDGRYIYCDGSNETKCERGYTKAESGLDVAIYFYPGNERVAGASCTASQNEKLYGKTVCQWDGDYPAECTRYEDDTYYCDHGDTLDNRTCYYCEEGNLTDHNRSCDYDCLVPFSYWQYEINLTYIAP